MAPSVQVSARAFSAMAQQATSYSRSCVHGVVLGKTGADSVEVTDVVPVCHETPSRTLVDMALGLVEAKLSEGGGSSNKTKIVGWFVGPEVLGDVKPGPVALRIVASLAGSADSSFEPVLLVLDNQALLAKDDDKTIRAFGKDFGGQWMEPLDLKIQGNPKGASGKGATSVVDLTDHWKSEDLADWKPLVAISMG